MVLIKSWVSRVRWDCRSRDNRPLRKLSSAQRSLRTKPTRWIHLSESFRAAWKAKYWNSNWADFKKFKEFQRSILKMITLPEVRLSGGTSKSQTDLSKQRNIHGKRARKKWRMSMSCTNIALNILYLHLTTEINISSLRWWNWPVSLKWRTSKWENQNRSQSKVKIGTNIPIRSSKWTDLISQQAVSHFHLKILKKNLQLGLCTLHMVPTLACIAN